MEALTKQLMCWTLSQEVLVGDLAKSMCCVLWAEDTFTLIMRLFNRVENHASELSGKADQMPGE